MARTASGPAWTFRSGGRRSSAGGPSGACSVSANPRAAHQRRIQLSSGRRYVRLRPAYQSTASDVEALRKHPHHAATDLYVDVPAGPGAGGGGGHSTGGETRAHGSPDG